MNPRRLSASARHSNFADGTRATADVHAGVHKEKESGANADHSEQRTGRAWWAAGAALGAVAGAAWLMPRAGEAQARTANKFVPIVSVGKGTRVGVARVSGPARSVESVRVVAMIEGRFKGRFRVNAMVPVATEPKRDDRDGDKRLDRVQDVAVTGLGNYRL